MTKELRALVLEEANRRISQRPRGRKSDHLTEKDITGIDTSLLDEGTIIARVHGLPFELISGGGQPISYEGQGFYVAYERQDRAIRERPRPSTAAEPESSLAGYSGKGFHPSG